MFRCQPRDGRLAGGNGYDESACSEGVRRRVWLFIRVAGLEEHVSARIRDAHRERGGVSSRRR